METLIVFVCVIGFFLIIGALFGKNKKTSRMKKLTVRIRDSRWNEDDLDSPMIKVVEGKGLFPHRRETNISFITSLRDDAEQMPVLCPINLFQESSTIAFQCEKNIGRLEPGGFHNWQRLGIIAPVLAPPYGGKRQLTAVVRMIDADNPPAIIAGFVTDAHSSVIWETRVKFDWTHHGSGYEEAEKNRDEARVLSLKIAMAVAMADGNLDGTEGILMQDWIKREVSPYEGERKEHLKNLYNTALGESFTEAKRGDLDIDELAARLNEIGEKPIKYEAIELCFNVMSADGVAHSEEMETIHSLAQMLELNMKEIESMRDTAVMELGAGNAKELLGIEPGWDTQEIKKHLRKEFMKWNGRMESLPAGEARDNAQRMLDAIAEIRNDINKEKNRNE